jgi:hypothetical protein
LISFSLLSPSPSLALDCEKCRQTGFVCGVFGCVSTYSCEAVGSFCTQCWESCFETLDGYCSVGPQCQWAVATPESDVLSAETTTSAVLRPAP